MKKIAKKILFPVFMSKIINSFPNAVALEKSMSQMENLFKFLCQEPRCGKLTEPWHMENCW